MANKPKRKHFTFIVVPHSEKSVLSFRIPITVIQLITVFIVAFWIGTLIFIDSYRNMDSHMEELETLRITTRQQADQIDYLVGETDNLRLALRELAELDRQVRELLQMDAARSMAAQLEPRDGVQVAAANRGGDEEEALTAAGKDAENLISLIDPLRTEVAVLNQSLERLKGTLADEQDLYEHTPNVWPTNGIISSFYGYRKSPFGWTREFHSGIDIAAPHGTPIRATANGVVTYASWYSSYGLYVSIDHGYGIETNYGHASKILVKVGQEVTKGDVIAYVGSTGRSTGPHLHYEVVRDGQTVNPIYYLDD